MTARFSQFGEPRHDPYSFQPTTMDQSYGDLNSSMPNMQTYDARAAHHGFVPSQMNLGMVPMLHQMAPKGNMQLLHRQTTDASADAAAEANESRKRGRKPKVEPQIVRNTTPILLPEILYANEDDIPCCVCLDVEEEVGNRIVFCDGCNIAVHQACYGIVGSLPEDAWFCRRCESKEKDAVSFFYPFPLTQQSCMLCPIKTGAMKPTTDGRWAHLLWFVSPSHFHFPVQSGSLKFSL